MSSNDIKYRVGAVIGSAANSFDIQIYSERFKTHVVLDDEFMEELNERLPVTYITALSGSNPINETIIYPQNPVRDCCDLNQCTKETKLDGCEGEHLTAWNSIDNDNTAPEEVSIFQSRDNEPENFEKLLAPTSDEAGETNVCISLDSNYLINTSEPLAHVNRSGLLSLNDEIKRNICHPDTTFQSDDNESDITGSTIFDSQTAVQNVPEADVRIVEESIYAIRNKGNSNNSSSHIPEQITQQMPSLRLSNSLQFVHDVQPCQKTQHDTDDSNECSEKNLASYVMRIQGIKTDADKGKSVLPRLHLPYAFILPLRRHEQSVYLMVAVIREVKTNNKRVLYVCNDMQFLPNNADKETEALNPIRLSLHSLPIEPDGTFPLSLRLINISSKSTTDRVNDKLFHELNEEIATNLHPTPYDSRFFRLACTLVKDSTIAWDTLCFSDYIRPKQPLITHTSA